tara:strand:+ start:348 stop:548 length:201 start_codon:yes stop_codon:yes gene_type:complete
MKVGDLVEHAPHSSGDVHIKALFSGMPGDFKVGLIIKERESFRLVAPDGRKPAWYQVEELKIISKS